MQPNYGEKSKLCYMDTNSFIVYIKTEDFCVVIEKDVETRLNTQKLERPFPKGRAKVIVIRKDESDEKVMTEFVSSRPKSIPI